MSPSNSNILSSAELAASKWAGAASVTSLSTGKSPAPKPTPGSGLSSSRYATTAPPQDSVSKGAGLANSKYASGPPKKSVEATSKKAQQLPVPIPHQAAPQQKGVSSKWANAASVTSLSTGKRAVEKTNPARGLQSSRSEWSEGLKLLAEMNRSNREKVFGSAKNGSIQMLKSRWADPEVKEKKSEEYEKMMEGEKKGF